MRRYCLLLALALLLAACTDSTPKAGSDVGAADSWRDSEPAAELRAPAPGTRVLPGTDAQTLAVETSKALYASAPFVVVTGQQTGQERAMQARAAAVALRYRAPLLVAPNAAAAADPASGEVARLRARVVLTVGTTAGQWAKRLHGVQVVAVGAAGALPRATPPAPLTGVTALASDGHGSFGAVVTARAAGAQVILTRQYDPRADAATVRALAHGKPRTVLALGRAFGAPDRLHRRVQTAMTGAQLPGGGQLVLPGKRYVALYGHPGSATLGVLGEQSLEATIARAKRVAAPYGRRAVPAVPALEIITTVASSAAGSDGDFSDESTVSQLAPWVAAARKANAYVILDLQPGTTDFLTQAKRYSRLLASPHVGLALDPEWRLRPGQRHMRQIGTVEAAEVNDVIEWLATFTRQRTLPQKMLLLHQFRLAMLPDRHRIDTSNPELSIVIQMDGHGPPGSKMATWRAITASPPVGIRFGWKNFYDEDSPTFTPARTLAVKPSPVLISYQ